MYNIPMNNQFEYEERYKVSDPATVQRVLEADGFRPNGGEMQTDHWFIPKYIMSPAEQTQWFDHDMGYAVRLREQIIGDRRKLLITSKQLLRPADHSAMTNNEADLNIEGMWRTLTPVGSEFHELLAELATYDGNHSLSLEEAKRLIESAGRKDYLIINKQRTTYRNAQLPDVVADLDCVPALANTDLGFSAAIELEYCGSGSLEEAKATVRTLSARLGYKQEDILTMALPGLAIKYLAVF